MNRIACVCTAFGLAAAGSTALAAETAKREPVMMTDAQMDNVTAGDSGGLVTVNVLDALNNWNLSIALKVQANVLANVNAGVALVGSAQASQLIGTQMQVTGNLQ